MKNDILMAFSSPNSNLRVVIATIAFGMGLDCPNVRRIIHWGPSVQMTLNYTCKKLDVVEETWHQHKHFCIMEGQT